MELDIRKWYQFIQTSHEGDVFLDSLNYDWLDVPDDEIADNLQKAHPYLTHNEVDTIIVMVRKIHAVAKTMATACQNDK